MQKKALVVIDIQNDITKHYREIIGNINQAIEWLGMSKIAFFADEMWAIPTIAFVNVWRHMGYTALLVFAGLREHHRGLRHRRRRDG